MTTAFCCALAFREDRKEIQGSDTLAELFLTDEAKKPLKDRATRIWAIQHLDSNDMERQFLTLNDGTIAENALSKFCFYYGVLSD